MGERGLAPTTRDAYGRVARSYLVFLESRGVDCLGDADGASVLGFLESLSNHYLAGGRDPPCSGWCRNFRPFLKFTGRADLVDAAGLAGVRRSHAILPVLSDDDERLVVHVCASGAVSARDAAITLLALTTGLRACDIIGLRLRDIDWRGRTVGIVQQKTNNPLTVPLAALLVGKLADYVSGRAAVAVQPVDQPAAVAGPVAGQPGHRYPPGAAAADPDDRGDPRRPQIFDRGGLIDWPHSSSKTIQPPRAAAVLFSAARSPSSTPRPRRRRARWPAARRAGRSSRDGAAGTRSPAPRVPHLELRRDQVPDTGQRPPLVFPPGGQRPGLQRQIQRRQLPLIQPALRSLPAGGQPGRAARPPGLPPPPHRPLADPQLRGDHRGRHPLLESPGRLQPDLLPASRPSAVSPPPCAYLMHLAYRRKQHTSPQRTSPIKGL